MATNVNLQKALALGVALVLIFVVPAGLASAANELTLDTALAKAQKGDAEAEFYLGKCYARGNGVPQDYAKAAGYFQLAAEQGFAFAQTDLGGLYARGQGVRQDDVEAARWYLKAATNGDPLGQYAMGLFYSQGRGVTNDPQESLKWFKRAAEQNQPDALLELGDIYLKGRPGIPINIIEARNWFEKSRDHGNYEADNSLGYIYESGSIGIARNFQTALDYYREAALKGNGRAAMNLGRFYLEGKGVKRDPVEAYKWFYLAVRNREMLGNHYLRMMEGRLPGLAGSQASITDAQRTEAIRQANELLKSMREQAKTAGD
jgi:TPR repeat protein